MLVQFFRVGGTAEVRKESAITGRGPGASNGQRAESRGPTKAKRDGKGKVWSQITKATDSCKTDKLTVSTSDYSRLVATGKPLSLKEFSKRKSVRDLPCLVKVVTGGHLRLCEVCDFGQEQMVVVLEKKSMRVVTCKDHMDGSSYDVPLHTTFFHLVPYWMDAERIHPNSFGRITANELLQSKALPLVFAVSVEFEVSEHHSKKTVPVGTLLFPKEKKRSKDRRQGVLRTKSESGEMVLITPDCNGRFSILACDVKLSLQQAITHLKVPFTMQTFSDCDTLYVDVVTVTVERVHKEEVLIGMMKTAEGSTCDDAAAYSRMVELPVSLDLTVVTMMPNQQEMLYQNYDLALAKYCGGMCQTAKLSSSPADRVAVASSPVHLTSPGKLAVQSTPSTPVLPSTTLQLSVATPNRNEHRHFLASQQLAPPHPTVGEIEDEQPPDADIDSYEAMPTPANQEMASHSKVKAWTSFRSEQPPFADNPLFMKKEDFVQRMGKEVGIMKAPESPPLDVARVSCTVEIPLSLSLPVVPKQENIPDHIYDIAHSDHYNKVLCQPVKSHNMCVDDGVVMTPNPAYIDISMATTYNMKAEPRTHSASFAEDEMPVPSAGLLPSTPLQLSLAAQSNSEEHVYEPIDNNEANPTAAANQQMAPPSSDSRVADSPFSDQLTCDDAVIDYSEETTTSTHQQEAKTKSNAAESPCDHSAHAVAIDYYETMPTVIELYERMPTSANRQLVPPQVAHTPFESGQSSSEALAVDYYEAMPTAETYPGFEASGTPFKSEQSLSGENEHPSMIQDGSVDNTGTNIAYLKKMQREDILHLLDAMNLSVYKKAFEQEQIDGETMTRLSGDVLIELGVSNCLHRLRLMRIVSGQTCASSYICISGP